MTEQKALTELCQVVDTLLGENGCPWDKAQTHQSLRADLLEETYEVADAIDNMDMPALREELGDLFLQVLMHSRIAEVEGHFNLSDVFNDVAKKLVSRHSHIFGEDKANNAEDAIITWEANKIKENGISSPLENMQAVPKALPALIRAQKVIKRSDDNFKDLFSTKSALDEIKLLLDNLRDGASEDSSSNKAEMEICGKILFLISQISVKKQINAEFSLTNAVQEFINSLR